MLSLNTPEEIQLWSLVYASAVGGTYIRKDVASLADKAVADFRERLPEQSPAEKGFEELNKRAYEV